jgi:hypothetical protein
LIQAPRTVRYVTRSRSEKRASYHSRSTRSWNVRTCIMSPDPLVHMHAHSAGTWQPTPAPTSMGNAAGRCALVHSTRLGAGANGPDSNPLLLDGWQGDKSDISCKLCFVAATSLSGDLLNQATAKLEEEAIRRQRIFESRLARHYNLDGVSAHHATVPTPDGADPGAGERHATAPPKTEVISI